MSTDSCVAPEREKHKTPTQCFNTNLCPQQFYLSQLKQSWSCLSFCNITLLSPDLCLSYTEQFPEQFIKFSGRYPKAVAGVIRSTSVRELSISGRRTVGELHEGWGEVISHMQGRPMALKGHKAILCVELLDFKGVFTELALIPFP